METRETDSENGAPDGENPLFQYVWSAHYIDAAVLRDENTDDDNDCTESGTDERLFYLNDANMNVTALVDTSGAVQERYVYDPYGQCTVYDDDWSATVDWDDSKKNPIRYCGYYFDDETGLYHVRHRSYHSMLGRWLQRDPIGYGGGISLQEYTDCSPATLGDPLGLRVEYGRYHPGVKKVNRDQWYREYQYNPNTEKWEQTGTQIKEAEYSTYHKGGFSGSTAV